MSMYRNVIYKKMYAIRTVGRTPEMILLRKNGYYVMQFHSHKCTISRNARFIITLHI